MQLFIKKRAWKKTEARGQVITLKQTGDTTVRFTALTDMFLLRRVQEAQRSLFGTQDF